MRKFLLFMLVCVFSVPTYAQLNCSNVNAAISLSASGATATLTNSSVPTASSTIYTFYTINWGDNVTTYAYNTNANQQHSYTASGTYTVTLYSDVLDSVNNIRCLDTATANISVTVPPLNCNNVNAALYVTPQAGGTQGRLTNNSTPTGGMNLSTQFEIKWGDGNTTYTSSKATQVHTYTANGNYIVWLKITAHDSANNITCVDSMQDSVSITGFGTTLNCSSVNAAFTKTTSGASVTLVNNSTPNIGSGITAVYTYYWGDGSSTVRTNKNNTSHTYSSSGAYTIKLVAGYTYQNIYCVDSTMDSVNIVINVPNIISGNIWVDSTSQLDSYKVWLITFDSNTNILAAVDSQNVAVVAGSGYYVFANKSARNYRTKAARLNGPTSGTGYVPTYHDSSLLWSSANVIAHNGGSTLYKHIYMKKGTVTSGPGFIGGNVLQGANKGTANGIEGLNILLMDANDNIITYAVTDVNGDYQFHNLPVASYKVYPEDLNYATTPYVVNVTSAKPFHQAVNFERSNSKMTINPLVTGIADVNNKELLLQVYPNPAHDVVTISWGVYTDDMANITISDISGKRVFSTQTNMNQNAVISVDGLQTGFYFMNVSTGFGSNTQKLIIK
ncbi:MAG: T9SS type A sorting domain-containing protein [Chitinophagales bacterium]|nr:T9SS type A sorting domain-containing protein [Chitinophagales bacterium]